MINSSMLPFLVPVIMKCYACLCVLISAPCLCTLIHLFVTSIQIGPFHGSHASKARIEVQVHLNLHGIIDIESVTVINLIFISSYCIISFERSF